MYPKLKYFACFVLGILFLTCSGTLFAQKTKFKRERSSSGKEEVKSSNYGTDNSSKEEVKSWSGSSDFDSDDDEDNGGGGLLKLLFGGGNDDDGDDDEDEDAYAESDDDDDEENEDEDEDEDEGSGSWESTSETLRTESQSEAEDRKVELADDNTSESVYSKEDRQEEMSLSGKSQIKYRSGERKEPTKSEQVWDSEETENGGKYEVNEKRKVTANVERGGKQAIKDRQGAGGKVELKEDNTGGNWGIFTDNIGVADPKPCFAREEIMIGPAPTPQLQKPKGGYSSGEIFRGPRNVAGPACVIPPADPLCLDFTISTEADEALACVKDASAQLSLMMQVENWCEPGFMLCFMQYMDQYEHCYACLPANFQKSWMEQEMAVLDQVYETASLLCVQEGQVALASAKRYLRTKASMLPGICIDVKWRDREDYAFVDTAFGIPNGGINFYNYVWDFNPWQIHDTLPFLAAQMPELRALQDYKDLAKLQKEFFQSDLRKLLLRKVGADMSTARNPLVVSREKAIYLAENSYWLARAIVALAPQDEQASTWQRKCYEFLSEFPEYDLPEQ